MQHCALLGLCLAVLTPRICSEARFKGREPHGQGWIWPGFVLAIFFAAVSPVGRRAGAKPVNLCRSKKIWIAGLPLLQSSECKVLINPSIKHSQMRPTQGPSEAGHWARQDTPDSGPLLGPCFHVPAKHRDGEGSGGNALHFPASFDSSSLGCLPRLKPCACRRERKLPQMFLSMLAAIAFSSNLNIFFLINTRSRK